MAKKKIKKLTRDSVVNLLGKINSEGMHYFFTGYMSADGLEDYCPGVPDEFYQAAKNFELASERMEAEMKKLQDRFKIGEEEIEY